MGPFATYLSKNSKAQVVWGLGFLLLVVGGVNDAVSFLSATWLPSWAPAVLAALLFYAAFQMIGFQLYQTAERVEAALARMPSAPSKPAPVEASRLPPGHARSESKWEPNMTLRELAQYVDQESVWRRPPRGFTPMEHVKAEIRSKLASGQLTAWARHHPSDPSFQVDKDAWAYVDEFRIDDAYAFLGRKVSALYDIRVSREEAETVWRRSVAS